MVALARRCVGYPILTEEAPAGGGGSSEGRNLKTCKECGEAGKKMDCRNYGALGDFGKQQVVAEI